MTIINLSNVLLNKLNNINTTINLTEQQISYVKNLIKNNPEVADVMQYDINKNDELKLISKTRSQPRTLLIVKIN